MDPEIGVHGPSEWDLHEVLLRLFWESGGTERQLVTCLSKQVLSPAEIPPPSHLGPSPPEAGLRVHGVSARLSRL